MNLFDRGLKALNMMFHGTTNSNLLGFRLPGESRIDYSRTVKDGLDSNVLTAPILWIARQFPEARPALKVGDELQHDHAIVDLLEQPNGFYSGEALWMATLFDFLTAGDAYWLKVKNRNGGVAELWFVPSFTIEPRWPEDGSQFISHYEYRPGASKPIMLDPEDVVHFRYGIDPRNTRKGFGLLQPLVREVFTDDEAATFTASMLRNHGVPGLVISPAKDQIVDDDDLQATKKFFSQEFSGNKRGRPLVMGAPTDVKAFGSNLKDMDLGVLRNVPEERVCSQLGIPAAVVGFGTGIQNTRVGATMKEMVRLAWLSGVIPIQRLLAGEVSRSLVPDFTSDGNAVFAFDTTDVTALQTAMEERAKTNSVMLKDGAITIGEYRNDMGFEADASHDVYLRPMNVLEVPVGSTSSEVQAGRDAVAADLARLTAPEAPDANDPPADDSQDPDDPETASAADPEAKAQPTDPVPESDITVEAQVAREGESAIAEGWQMKLVNDLDVMTETRADKWTGTLMKFFDELGAAAVAASIEVLGTEESPKARFTGVDWKPARGRMKKADRDVERKAAEDEAAADAIVATMATQEIIEEWKRLYGEHYLETARATYKGTNAAAGLAVQIPDQVARDIIEIGERRSLVVNVSKQTRDRIVKELVEAREAGEGINDIQRRLRDKVPAGRWKSSSVRARVIARTETTFARNASMVQFSKQVDGAQMMVFDARGGSSDEVCEALDGRIVSIEQAEQLTAEEHPNGTRSFSIHLPRGN